MRCRYLDGPQCLGVQPAVSMAKAEGADRIDLTIDDGELKFTIKRRGFDLSPLRCVE